ncbi:general transcription factor 3C polypeptide 1 isoform X2 [Denticeps clupeoides]|uniref:general transcription factor 3C polypeptide 1 isoform X2 n=1 Tax=Denticeps clupeoides TaxID=299321 RepID=UPI0010A2EA42|nr:general transcription factor 3C polypeptide 1 isoform X2 [Denticeps clupeoides]
MDALEVAADEVALEGLDGITASGLWTRLENRVPEFLLSLDGATKEHLWRSLVCNPEMSFYENPRARRPVVLFDRFAEIDPDTGIQEIRRVSVDPAASEDVYPVHIVHDQKDGTQGSCLYFEQRKDVSAEIRRDLDLEPRVTLEDATERWGEKLTIVASQRLRYRTLIGPEGDPDLKLSDPSYCILERLGRARWQGELQRDLHTNIFKTDAGKLHYLRKSLSDNGLITMQTHLIRLPTGGHQCSILLLLRRFHVDRRSKYDILMEMTSNILSSLPNNTGIVLRLRDQLHISDRTFKRVYQYMLASKLIQLVNLPLHDLTPEAGPCKTQKGTDIIVRCIKLLKPYGRKEDDEDDDEDASSRMGGIVSEGRDVERDLMHHAYEIVVRAGTRGISQTDLRGRLNVGKLESRMICRVLERNNMIKGFMEDEGRQRTTKYISKMFVEKSDLNHLLMKEKAKSEKLRVGKESIAMETALTEAASQSHAAAQSVEDQADGAEEHMVQEEKKKGKGKGGGKKGKKAAKVGTGPLMKHSTPLKTKSLPPLDVTGDTTFRGTEPSEKDVEEEPDLTLDISATPASTSTCHAEDEKPVVEEVLDPREKLPLPKGRLKHQTYRLLKRKNLIIEAVRNLKIIESVYTLQKMLIDEERTDGVNTRVCKKSIIRLIHTLSKEGLLRLYRTTVIQDGVQKKVEFVVHPSITPDDPLVKSAIEQVRFRISGSYSVVRMKALEERKLKEKEKRVVSPSHPKNANKIEKKMGVQPLKDFRPTIVPGYGRSLGYQPKMPRLQLVHIFLWYIIHGHPLKQGGPSQTDDSEPQASTSSQEVRNEASAAVDGTPADQMKVYADEISWKRYVPPTPVHTEYTSDWALTSDILIALPLSLFIQIVHISFKVEGLEEYLNDPVKKHYLIRYLPSNMKRQLLYKRKYVFSFSQCLERLCFMGLLQFGPMEKFQEKDQTFVYMRKHATIVDTTLCEPHYKMAYEMRPFERRRYAFNTAHDLDNFWFDLMCVCLNTPLGVVRQRLQTGEEQESEDAPDKEQQGHHRYSRLHYTIKGSVEIIDDMGIPGDGLGAGGLDSDFYAHLKRNWIWNYQINGPQGSFSIETKSIRLRNLLSTHKLSKSVPPGTEKVNPPVLQEEDVRVAIEPSSQIQQNHGGKKQKRKRLKKDVGTNKPPKKKRRATARQRQFLDETDKQALQMMTRKRVTWTKQEDSMIMLCRVASHFLNRKIKKPFVPWQVVRDLLRAEFHASVDKTSLSVGRRSRYIMKNPQTCLNFKICLAEVYQDKHLVAEFQNRQCNYDDQQVCSDEFREFIGVLRQKFSSAAGSCSIDIPDSKEELFQKFRVYVIGDETLVDTQDVLTNQEDIHALVLNNLIQSTLALSNYQMKTCRSFQTFHMYSKYKQPVLFKAFERCQSRGLVNRRRNGKHEPRKDRSLPILPMSYQLSQGYYRRFLWRFPATMCNEVFDFHKELIAAGREDRSSTFHFQVPENKNQKTPVKTGQPGHSSNPSEASEVLEKLEGMVQVPIDASGGACLTGLTLMSLGFLSFDVTIPDQIVVVDSAMTDNEVVRSLTKEVLEDEDEDEDGESRRKFEVRAPQASHTTYLLMRGFYIPGILSTRNNKLNSNDNIVVNSCTLHVKLRDTPSHKLFYTDDVETVVFQSALVPLPSHFSRLFHSEGTEMEALARRCETELGYAATDLQAQDPQCDQEEGPAKKRPATEPLDEEARTAPSPVTAGDDVRDAEKHRLQDQLSSDQETCKPSLDVSKGDFQKFSFVSRPWRTVDGSLNLPVCKGMIEGVLAHIMSQPGLTERHLVQHYIHLLQPTVTLDLVQVLVELGCVKRRFLLSRPQTLLFSEPRCSEVSGYDVGPNACHDATAFYEPTMDAALRLAKVFPHERNWNKWGYTQHPHSTQTL